MSISFNNIPSNIRVPLFYAEVDNSKANSGATTYRSLIIAPMDASGTGVAGTPVLCSSAASAKTIGGVGSVLHLMVKTYRASDNFGELWVLPVADASGSAHATGALTVGSSSTDSGTVELYVAGVLIEVPVTSSDTPTAVAAHIAAAVQAKLSLPVNAAVSGTNPAQVVFTAKNGGTIGNDIPLVLNYLGAAGGQYTPPGMTLTITPMSGGSVNPDITNALANLGDTTFDYICMPFTDSTNLASMRAFLSTKTGRWAWNQQLYGHCFTAYFGTVAGLTTFGNSRNDEHLTVMGVNGAIHPSWMWAADMCGTAAVSLRADPAKPLQTLQLSTVTAPPQAYRFQLTDRNTLLWDGISTFICNADNSVSLENVITTYQTNGFGEPDDSYLQVETLYTLAYALRYMKSKVTSNFSRVKLGSTTDTYDAGAAVVTTETIRSFLLAAYQDLVYSGYCQNYAAFKAGLVVERNATNPNRVDVLWPGVLINQLRIMALLAQFRLS